MCVVSNIGDSWGRRVDQTYPWLNLPPVSNTPITIAQPTKAEFDALKRDVEELKELLKAAKAIDEYLGEPDCENDEKLAVLRKVAELVGVDLEDVLR